MAPSIPERPESATFQARRPPPPPTPRTSGTRGSLDTQGDRKVHERAPEMPTRSPNSPTSRLAQRGHHPHWRLCDRPDWTRVTGRAIGANVLASLARQMAEARRGRRSRRPTNPHRSRHRLWALRSLSAPREPSAEPPGSTTVPSRVDPDEVTSGQLGVCFAMSRRAAAAARAPIDTCQSCALGRPQRSDPTQHHSKLQRPTGSSPRRRRRRSRRQA